MQVGFIGLGRMGSGLARNLLKAGYSLHVYDINTQAVASLVALGAQSASSATELAHVSDVLFTSLPLPQDVENVLLGEMGCLSALPVDGVMIDVSTIDLQTARRLTDAATQSGKHFLACPLGKGPAQAAEGTEPIFAGGEHAIFERCKPLLDAVGKPVYYLGDVEQSTAFKLISNLIGFANMAVLAEGITLGLKAGIEPQQLQTLLADTGADSYQLKLRGPFILNEDYAPRFSVALTAKDLRLAVAMARAWDIEPSLGAQASAIYQQALTQGLGNEDAAAIYKIVQQLSQGKQEEQGK